jgi:hypothetical protein
MEGTKAQRGKKRLCALVPLPLCAYLISVVHPSGNRYKGTLLCMAPLEVFVTKNELSSENKKSRNFCLVGGREKTLFWHKIRSKTIEVPVPNRKSELCKIRGLNPSEVTI